MTEIMCKSCRANPPAVAGLCAPCWRDKDEADRKRRHLEELRLRQDRRRGQGRSEAGWGRTFRS